MDLKAMNLKWSDYMLYGFKKILAFVPPPLDTHRSPFGCIIDCISALPTHWILFFVKNQEPTLQGQAGKHLSVLQPESFLSFRFFTHFPATYTQVGCSDNSACLICVSFSVCSLRPEPVDDWSFWKLKAGLLLSLLQKPEWSGVCVGLTFPE